MEIKRKDGTTLVFEPFGPDGRANTGRMARIREFMTAKGIARFMEIAKGADIRPENGQLSPYLERALQQGWLIRVGRGVYATKEYAALL